MTLSRLNCQEQFEQTQADYEVAEGRTSEVKQLIYDLHPYKSPCGLSTTFKFDPVKFSESCFKSQVLLDERALSF